MKDSSVGGLVDLKNRDSPKEKLGENSVLKSNAEHEESTNEVADKKASALNLKEPEDFDFQVPAQVPPEWREEVCTTGAKCIQSC